MTLGGDREVLVEISDTNFSFQVISKTGGCYVITPSGHTITLYRRQRTYWLKGRISTGGEVEVLTIAAVKTNPEVQDPSDEQATEAASSSNRSALPVPEPQRELQENRDERALLRETDGDALEVLTEAVAAKVRCL